MPLADVKDAISKSLLTTKQDDLFSTTLNQWVTDAKREDLQRPASLTDLILDQQTGSRVTAARFLFFRSVC